MTLRDISAELMLDQAHPLLRSPKPESRVRFTTRRFTTSVYVELPDVEETFLAAADRLGVVLKIVTPGNEVAIR
jgi:hypothetical protein